MSRTTLSPGEALVVVLICFGLSIAVSVESMLDGFSGGAFTNAGAIWLIGTEALLAAAALLFLRARNYDIGSLWPQPTWRGAAQGLFLFVLGWVLGWVVRQPFRDEAVEKPDRKSVV